MKKIHNRIGVETIIFAKTIEPEAYEQIAQLANHEPYLNSKIRVMPDAHVGKGCTIGTTMTINDKLTPNLVGVDIGCGMLTVKLQREKIDFKELDKIIRQHIPSGFHIHKRPQKQFDLSKLRSKQHVDTERAAYSIGSLGGGNHFIEIGEDKKENLYLIIHSGSRKLGSDICNYYQQKAISNLRSKYKRGMPSITERDLAYLEGNDFDDYMNDMTIAQKFASINRNTMAEIILRESGLKAIEQFETIHNYIDFKHKILRKGAVSAQKDEVLLIPINMRDGSLLCIGKGNENWNFSAPHGAGRLMSRTQAKKKIEMQQFLQTMKNVYTTSLSKGTIDEAPDAYKSIDEIKELITDTVDIIEEITPLYNFKAK